MKQVYFDCCVWVRFKKIKEIFKNVSVSGMTAQKRTVDISDILSDSFKQTANCVFTPWVQTKTPI